MQQSTYLPWILTACVASVAGMVSGVHAGFALLSWASALMFALALVATSLETNRRWWSVGAAAVDPAAAAEVNTQLVCIGYLWGSLALLAVYRLTGIRWQHGLQYGAGMALIAMLLMGYLRLIERPGSALRAPRALAVAAQLNVLHGAGALGGLAFLTLSGKLMSAKGDWAANQVFLAGGLAIVGLSALAAVTHSRLSRNGARQRQMAEAGGNH